MIFFYLRRSVDILEGNKGRKERCSEVDGIDSKDGKVGGLCSDRGSTLLPAAGKVEADVIVSKLDDDSAGDNSQCIDNGVAACREPHDSVEHVY